MATQAARSSTTPSDTLDDDDLLLSLDRPCEMSQSDFDDLLAQLGSDDFTETDAGRELLDAARYNDIDVCKAILKVFPNCIYYQAETDHTTALHMAAANGHVRVAQVLTLLDASLVWLVNQAGNTPLHWAASNGQLAMVKLLLSLPKVDVLVKNKAGHSILTEGFLSKNEELIQVLLEHDSASEERLVVEQPKTTQADTSKREESVTHELLYNIRLREWAIGSRSNASILGQDHDGQDDTTGFSLWAASMVGLHWMHDTDFTGQTVLELGAGCGALGMAAARTAARVILSDFNAATVNNCRHNIGLNTTATANMQAMIMNWHDPATYPDTAIDVVIGSDLVYQTDQVDALLSVLTTLRPSTFLYCASNAGRQGHELFVSKLYELFDTVNERPAANEYLTNPLQNQDDEACFLHFHELTTANFVLYECTQLRKD